jgi:hypothetical protein
MTDWITARAEGIRNTERERKDERERQIVASNELKAKTQPFWNDLLTVLDQSVQQFNREFPEAERRIDQYDKSTATTLTIRRTSYPAVTVKVSLTSGGISIQYSISVTERKGAIPVEKQANFTLQVIDGEVGYAEGSVNIHEDLAKLFLEPFFAF